MRKKFFPLGLLVFFLVLLSSQAPASTGKEDVPQLAVRGTAILNVPADRLNLDIGVSSDARQAEEALKLNSRKMNGVLKALEKAGLTKKEYQTGRFDIRPQWSPRPKNADREWRPHIVGFTVTSRLSIKTLKQDMGGLLIEAAVEAGANDIGSLYFDLSDPRKYRQEAIREATANALSDARTLAKAAGVDIVRVLSLNLDRAQPAPVRMNYERVGVMKTMAAAEPPPIVAGDVAIHAAVDIIFQIGENK